MKHGADTCTPFSTSAQRHSSIAKPGAKIFIVTCQILELCIFVKSNPLSSGDHLIFTPVWLLQSVRLEAVHRVCLLVNKNYAYNKYKVQFLWQVKVHFPWR